VLAKSASSGGSLKREFSLTTRFGCPVWTFVVKAGQAALCCPAGPWNDDTVRYASAGMRSLIPMLAGGSEWWLVWHAVETLPLVERFLDEGLTTAFSAAIAWQRRKFREHWTRLSRKGGTGRPAIPLRIRELIRRMSRANPYWGAPRILGELSKLGIVVAEATVHKYMLRRRRPPSPTWRAFLNNHAKDLVAIDFFVVSTVRFRALFVLVVLAHHRRRVLHFNVTEYPTAQWTAQQIAEAFPWGHVPRYLLRDRDGVYGKRFRDRVRGMGIEEVMTAPRAPGRTPMQSA